jgi:hypothetical protein
LLKRPRTTSGKVQFERTLSALPFAFLSAFLAFRGLAITAQIGWIMPACMVILFPLVLLGVVLGRLGLASLGPVTVLLAYEHSLVRLADLSQVNAAFFTVSSWISVLLLVATGIDIPWRRVAWL